MTELLGNSSFGLSALRSLRFELTAFSTIGPCIYALAAAVRREPGMVF
jgi:hypothetical protein